MSENGDAPASKAGDYSSSLDGADGYSKIWDIVKDTAKVTLGEHRVGIMLFLDDLPLRLGAYHPLGTNNIVLNRTLVEIVDASTKSRRLVNAFVYILLLHEYLHALGHVPESRVRRLVYEVSSESFGEDHVVSRLARAGPWSLLKDVPLDAIEAPKRVMEIVRDFEQAGRKYIA
jgi:hypothetical protein